MRLIVSTKKDKRQKGKKGKEIPKFRVSKKERRKLLTGSRETREEELCAPWLSCVLVPHRQNDAPRVRPKERERRGKRRLKEGRQGG